MHAEDIKYCQHSFTKKLQPHAIFHLARSSLLWWNNPLFLHFQWMRDYRRKEKWSVSDVKKKKKRDRIKKPKCPKAVHRTFRMQSRMCLFQNVIVLFIFSVWTVLGHFPVWKQIFHREKLCPLKSESAGHSVVSNFVTPWTVALQAPLSKELSRQECWSGLPLASSRDLPNPVIKLVSPAL